ncbi:exosortase family protein XrtF [Flavobacterium macacae]|uniref:Exosortase family protein XrtF n=1 Tax=Flavobacterium macacae TaxID=2488993 RepID=A0A3P3WKS7_9FLAO|nr:exosortase family protein XrtF [Flavobacterium macacae]RRJ93693.1 exosortase family protein XrtF [Flavobacterium macacae]
MKKYFHQYRPFFVFLLKFFVTYGILTFCYQMYLNGFDSKTFETDGMTKFVAYQTEDLLQIMGQDAYTVPHFKQACMKLFFNGKYIARVVEGCNAMSVMILFVAFVVAFKGKLRHTLLFIIAGIFIIHVLNVLRIALLSMALFHYREYEHILHGVIFPLFIYGVVFGLWVIWVQKFSTYAKAS